MKLQNFKIPVPDSIREKGSVSDKFIIGIGRSKNKHQAMVLDPKGISVGNSFSFQSSYNGFLFKLWQHPGFS